MVCGVFFAEDAGGGAVLFAEGTDQVAFVGKAAIDGDLRHGQLGGSQQSARVIDLLLQPELMDGGAGDLLKILSKGFGGCL